MIEHIRILPDGLSEYEMNSFLAKLPHVTIKSLVNSWNIFEVNECYNCNSTLQAEDIVIHSTSDEAGSIYQCSECCCFQKDSHGDY